MYHKKILLMNNNHTKLFVIKHYQKSANLCLKCTKIRLASGLGPTGGANALPQAPLPQWGGANSKGMAGKGGGLLPKGRKRGNGGESGRKGRGKGNPQSQSECCIDTGQTQCQQKAITSDGFGEQLRLTVASVM